MKRTKKHHLKRKTKAIIGIILCISLAAANIALNNRTWTRKSALEDLMDYHSTGEVDIITELPELLIKYKGHYRFYLVENENCFAQFCVNNSFWYGWGDGPCLIVEKYDSKMLQATYNSFISARDEDKEMLRVFGLVRDESISRIEIEINFAVTGADQTLKKLILKTDSFIEYEGVKYFCIDHIYVDKLSEHLMPPFTAMAYNAENELVYSENITLGQSTSLG
ncbi:MAG: hypothetical protein IJY96_00945 [Oscillospiraceae bacterium]|nr:hypothetical protein [Oscillospiraceae bacterium]